MLVPDLSCAVWRKSTYSGTNGDCVEAAALGGGLTWRKSTYSGQDGACMEAAVLGDDLAWRKSSHSGQNGNCVVVAGAVRCVAVRDSKDPGGPVLAFRPAVWRDFTARIRGGELS